MYKDRYELMETCADYIIQYKWSIREVARNVGVSKTTVHRWIHTELKYLEPDGYDLYDQCMYILKKRRNR